MNIEFTGNFLRKYSKLNAGIQKIFEKKLGLFKQDMNHPSLRIKKIQGTENIYEGSVNMNIRFTFQFKEGGVLLRNIGPHDPTLKKP